MPPYYLVEFRLRLASSLGELADVGELSSRTQPCLSRMAVRDLLLVLQPRSAIEAWAAASIFAAVLCSADLQVGIAQLA